MTEEQIKQNAETYAELVTAGNKEHYRAIYTAAKEGYETGAHSRDMEVKELSERVEELQEYARLLQHVIDRDRNPWISVEDRLPEDDVEVISH